VIAVGQMTNSGEPRFLNRSDRPIIGIDTWIRSLYCSVRPTL